jgi:UDP-glucuronate 4-epimerase
MRNFLVTGGAGFIGSHVVDHLLSRTDSRVTIIDNFSDFYNPRLKRNNIARHLGNDRFRVIEADISSERAVPSLFAESTFDCIVHLAARAGIRPSVEDPLSYERTNVRGTYALLESAVGHSVPQFIFGSSSSVYGGNAKIPFSEEDPIGRPISPYAATKVAGEVACHAYSHLYGIRVVCLRFFTVYGPRQRPDLAIHKFARLITESKPLPIYGDGSASRDFTYIDDIIAGIDKAIQFDGSPFEIFNLGGSQTIRLTRLIALLEASLGKRAILDRRPFNAGDMALTQADISKARKLLGYEPVTDIERGIRQFVEWFLEDGVDSPLRHAESLSAF